MHGRDITRAEDHLFAYAVPFTGYLVRGIPTGVPGDPTDFTMAVEDCGRIAHLLTAERIKTRDQYRRMRRLLKEIGFESAMAQRSNGKYKYYKL